MQSRFWQPKFQYSMFQGQYMKISIATVHTRMVAGRCWETGSWGLAEGRPATGPQHVRLKTSFVARLLHEVL